MFSRFFFRDRFLGFSSQLLCLPSPIVLIEVLPFSPPFDASAVPHPPFAVLEFFFSAEFLLH